MSILSRFLEKRKIKDVNELDKEERQQFETWQKILSKEELTIDDVKKFCEAQCDLIENKWKDYDIPQAKKAEWITAHTIYSTLSQIMESPKVGREQLEQYLNELLK